MKEALLLADAPPVATQTMKRAGGFPVMTRGPRHRRARSERETAARWLAHSGGTSLEVAYERYGGADAQQRHDWREGQRLAELRWRESA